MQLKKKIMLKVLCVARCASEAIKCNSTQLTMRSLRPEHFSTSKVVLHTCGPSQTAAKYVPYRRSITYLFVLRGANKKDFVLFKTILYVQIIYYLNFNSSSWNCSWELRNSAHRWRVNIFLELILTKLKSWKLKTFFFYTLRVKYFIDFFCFLSLFR